MASFHCEVGSVKRVAIIGAGVSGLVAIKSCLEEELEPVCFERSSTIGGIWAPQKRDPADSGAFVYSSMVFNTSKEMTCFSDYPYPKSYPPYIRKKQHWDYLMSYAESFGLKDFIRFNTAVTEVSPVSHLSGTGGSSVQKWRVKVKDTKEKLARVKEEVFDAVMVCTGYNSEASEPKYRGQDNFMGWRIHSHRFRQGSDYQDENVVVIGDRNSAGDVAVECSRHAQKVFLSMHRGTLLLPRFVAGGVPIDAYANSLLGTYIPRVIRGTVLAKLMSNFCNPKDLGLEIQHPPEPPVMINEELPNRIMCGTVKPKPAIKEFKRDALVFSDGTTEKVDTVICATGYHPRFPFIDDNILADDPKKRALYLNTFPTATEQPTLATVGMFSVAGPVGPVCEMQARCAVAVFKGTARLPTKQEMEGWIVQRREESIRRFGRLRTQLDSVSTMLELSELVGCRPLIWKYILQGDFKLASRLIFGPFYPYATRLEGRHSWPGARQAIINGMDNMFSATRAPPSQTVKITREVKWRNVIVLILIVIFILYQVLPFT